MRLPPFIQMTVLGLSGLLCLAVGCEQPEQITRWPANTLHVRYEPAEAYSTCLVASVAMASNYLLNDRAFTAMDKFLRSSFVATITDLASTNPAFSRVSEMEASPN